MSGGMPGSVQDLMERAAARLPAPVAAYLAMGSGAGITAAEATPAWEALRFAPRVLRSVTDVSLRDADGLLPFGIAPATLQRAVHPDGELATARGAAEAGARMVVSSNTGTPFAAIAETGVTWWLQTYLPPDRPSAEPLLQRAVDAGAAAVVLTADTPVVARKRDAVAARVWGEIDPAYVGAEHAPPPPEVAEGGEGTDRYREKATDLGPHDIGWLAAVTGLPVVVKGVLRADDAQRCIDAGAAAVWVSNHGGRQFDGALPTARALPGVVGAAGHVPVYVDGGLREARHLCGAWALGAEQAFLARPVLAALAVGGAAGVRDLLLGLGADLVEALRLLGATTPAELVGTVADDEPHRGSSPVLDRSNSV
jgi:4-hydroxymandelate oxidase